MLLERIVEILSVDSAAVLLLEDDGQTLTARAAKGLEEAVEQRFSLSVGAGFAGRVASERRPVAIAELAPGRAVNPLLYEKGIRSLLGVPLIAAGRVLGVLHVGSRAAREFGDDETQLLQAAADRIAIAIAHERALEAERRARSDAERAIERVTDLQSVTEAALAYLDLETLLDVLLDRAKTILHANTAAVLLLEEDGKTLAARAAKGLEEEVERGFTLPVGEGFAGRVAAERRPVALPRVLPGTVVNPLMFEKGVKSLLGVPLVVERRLIGVLHVGTLTQRDFTADDAELLQLVADRAALAIEHDRLFEQHKIAQTLQRSLLPAELPQLPAVTIAARYRPAARASAVGGDWYDVIPLIDGRVGVAIGDVVGHGLGAATHMGSLRSGLHAYAVEELSPAEVAARLARYSETVAPGRLTTYVYGVVDPARGTFTFVNASHPRPLLVRPDGTAEYVESPIAPPLGVPAPPSADERTIPLEPGCSVLLYTDGLIERRGVRMAGQQEALLAIAKAAPFDPELLCDSVLANLVGNGTAADDVALLAVQRQTGSDSPLAVKVATRAEELAAIRRLLRGWLRDAGADESTVSAVLLAAGEACANAMEHAYGPGDETFDVAAELDGDEVVVVVRDHGKWRPPRGRNRGRGLGLIEAFMDQVDVQPGESGTIVTMRKRLAVDDGRGGEEVGR